MHIQGQTQTLVRLPLRGTPTAKNAAPHFAGTPATEKGSMAKRVVNLSITGIGIMMATILGDAFLTGGQVMNSLVQRLYQNHEYSQLKNPEEKTDHLLQILMGPWLRQPLLNGQLVNWAEGKAMRLTDPEKTMLLNRFFENNVNSQGQFDITLHSGMLDDWERQRQASNRMIEVLTQVAQSLPDSPAKAEILQKLSQTQITVNGEAGPWEN